LRWNEQLFLIINASGASATAGVELARLLANSPIVVAPVLLTGLWVWGSPNRRGGLISVALGMLIGLSVNQLLGFAYFEPRPFMIGIGHTLLQHPSDNSFPSDHVTFIWAMGFGLISTRSARGYGVVTCLYGMGVAWARVFLGVHFPLDMMASFVVAITSAGIAAFCQPVVTTWVLPVADGMYEMLLQVLHMPQMLIPRQSRHDQIPPR